jgi:hypothetical protein
VPLHTPLGLDYVAHARELSVLWHGPDLEYPFLHRGRCYCGAPLTLQRSIDQPWRWTLSHDEIELISANEYQLISNDRCRAEHNNNVGICLIRDALAQLHRWLLIP